MYNIHVKISEKMRLYSWIEFAIWLLVIALIVFGIKYFNYKKLKQYRSYQIFMSDVDGLIVGSPVKFLGIEVGHVTKTQIVSSNVYVKFIITQKDLELPQGSVATIEGSGLGGSKALEIYPPERYGKNDRIISVKDPTRLGKVMGLFKDIFKDLDEIITSFTYASAKLDAEKFIPQNVVIPDDNNTGFTTINKNLDSMMNNEKNFKRKLNPVKKGEKDEPEQSESNQ